MSVNHNFERYDVKSKLYKANHAQNEEKGGEKGGLDSWTVGDNGRMYYMNH